MIIQSLVNKFFIGNIFLFSCLYEVKENQRKYQSKKSDFVVFVINNKL